MLFASEEVNMNEKSKLSGCLVTTCEEYWSNGALVRDCKTTIITDAECVDFSDISIEPFKDVLVLLSEVEGSEDLPDTVHENEKVLKAMASFLQLPDIQEMKEDRLEMLFSYLCGKAGWKEWTPSVKIKRVKRNLYLVGIGYAAVSQPSSLYVFYDTVYKKIAAGENGTIYVIDFRLVNDELGVIFYRIPGSTHPLIDFALIGKEKGEWHIKWTPNGQREWIVTDGEIKFLKDDLSLLEVRGTSFALQSAEQQLKDEVFVGGPERYFIGIWERKGNAYVRRTKLPSDVPFYDRLWEMTDFSESLSFYGSYATVFEFLRRLRNREDERAAELSNKKVVEEAEELGLSQTVDPKGNIIFYDWGFNRDGKAEPVEEEKRLLDSAPNGTRVEFFFRANTGEQYMAILKPLPIQPDQIRWQIIDIERINKRATLYGIF
jgi:hypothetical protein